MWVAMEGATLATVLLVSLYRSPEAVEAAWKYFILCIVGIALALFGTILIYFSAIQVIPDPKAAIFWNVLHDNAKQLNPTISTLAFVFLLVGYGTKIGLVPLHNWLPDAHSESPAPMSTLLSGLLLNIALYALVRFKILVDINLNNNLPGNLMICFGILSFLLASILLHRQNNIKRLFSYSSIEHMGLMTFAFGIGGKLATFAALIYMIAHSLLKSAIFMNTGNVILITGTQLIDKIRNLIKLNPKVGWLLLISCLAISGFPPFGIFTSELLLIVASVKISVWFAVIIIIGMIIALAGLLHNIQPVIFGESALSAKHDLNKEPAINKSVSLIPVVLHLIIAAIMGVYLPPYLTACLNQAVKVITP
jgi:hydrogenase-4 component F